MWLLLLIACTDGPEEPEDEVDPEVLNRATDAYLTDLMGRQCAGCHSGDSPSAELDLSDDPIGSMTEADADQAEMFLIEPGSAEYSYAWHKMNGTHSIAGGLGTVMPPSGALDPIDVAAFAVWIDRL